MIKTLSKAQKMEREKFRIPRSVQDAIPIRRIFADGIFQVGNQYSKTWSFTDINYAIASKEDKTPMFLDYSELLNALDSGASAKITIYNRRINKAEFEKSVLLPDKADGLDEYRHEFNKMLTAQVTGTSNSIVRERYLTVSVVKRNADEARSYFARVGTDLVTHLAQLSSVAQELTLTERLHIFRDFFKAGEQAAAEFNIHEHAKRGQHFKDWFCPDSMEFAADHFKLDARYGRVLYLQDYASYIKDSFVSELCDLDRDLMLSIDILPVPTDEAARQLQSTLLGVETNVANWQRRQNANNNFTATIPYDMELQRKETKEMLDDLTTRDQRMMFGLVTLVHLADNKEQLDSDTETLYSTARKHLCQLSTLRWQQKDGLDTVLPYGLRKIQALRTLTTESTAVLIPFRAQEIMQPNGLYYGQNAVSKNMIVADRRLLLNGNSFRLGVSGSGKSMSAKEEIVQIALSTEDDILILDPESEFGYLTEALGGEVIRISATSDTHINALDMHNKLIVNHTQIFAPALHDLYAAQKILDDNESQRQELNQQIQLLAKKLHNLSRLREKNCITAAQYWERRNPLERELTDVKNTISKAATNHPLLRTLAQTKQLAEHYTYLKPLTEFDEYEFKFAVNRVLVDSESCTFELKNGMKFKEIF
ncbi:VirB4-like conjugal transfer ATPase, CD1110 family [uncultured Gemmiger sp.]|uniref:VirB4-like conjugal transfer ATPase, CD1110 family n=1 Tax=uncultured Gemmiger sp. TaxID=1623490 RepID=UPI002803E2C6|nr:DUF87 domain-containing protein [uncultured Gemmiger sp.]